MVRYQSIVSWLIWGLALAFAGFEFYTVGFEILSPLSQRATMLAFAAVLVFLHTPARQWTARDDLTLSARSIAALWDFALIIAALSCCGYLILNEADLSDRIGAETQADLIVAFIGPIVVLEMVRRVAGFPLFIISLTVVIYAYWGDVVLIGVAVVAVLAAARHWGGNKMALIALAAMLLLLTLPGVTTYLDPASFIYPGTSHDRLAAYLWLTTDGTFGSITGIMTEFIFIFILLSGLLEATGAGRILMDLAFALTGRFRGGPAQSAVVASSLFGMVSGSTMANVVSTGTFTIPLMIRTGFSRTIAGAIEAVASCGGQIMPPIMGASVFIMAEIIGVPYLDLMIYGLVPALLYFFSLTCSIYFEASRLNLRGLEPHEIPSVRAQVEKGGYLLIPVVILMASIVSGETPGRAGFKAVVALLVMVDLVRSFRWIRYSYGSAGVAIAALVSAVALGLAFGPVSMPDLLNSAVSVPLLGEVELVRLGLVALGLACAIVPGLRGWPIALPLGLAIANWSFPSELLWLGQIPYVGWLLPLLLAALIVYLIALPILSKDDVPEARESAREYGLSIVRGFEKGAMNSLSLVAATSAVGMLVGLLVLAALGVRISIFVTEVASVSLFLALLLVMAASLVMGMGLPTVAAYLLLVIVVAPALQELGTSLVAAHMFIFYFGVISSITPPVALAAYGASGISGANAMQTGIAACRLAITAFIVPFLFTIYPELLLLEGTATEFLYRLAVCAIGIYLIAMAAMGYGFAPLGWLARCLLVVAALLLFLNSGWLHAAGFLLGAGHLGWQRMNGRHKMP